ncbi:MAG TPA: DUF3224 domain-containing protein [Streptosporangiaceae bacterium]|jgi:hypothetical protein|nr:DUF3224 domain-containing protein [Streptosporangiaceae bacterium]
MTEHAKGTFTVSGWDETTYAELDEKGKLTKARMTFDFAGDVQGQGVSETLMCYRQDGTAVFTGLQHMVGQVGGRSGSYVLLADGSYDGAEARTAWKVVDGSGTGELAGLRGTGSAVAASSPPGTFSFDYELG